MSLISSISTSVTLKLDNSNDLPWHFKMQLLLEDHGIIRFVYGSTPCPAQFLDTNSRDSEVNSECSFTQFESDDFNI